MTTLIIARHGNTFGPDDIPTRVGKHTDLSLVESGREQAAAIGRYLQAERLIPDVIYASNLQRTQETARIAVKESGVSNPVFTLDMFDEIDYGPDENKVEADVIARVGLDAIAAWDAEAIVPEGWVVDPAAIIKNWQDFGEQIRAHDDNETVLVVTSNGVARFAPYLTGDFDGFRGRYDIKLATGAIGVMVYDGGWQVREWGLRV